MNSSPHPRLSWWGCAEPGGHREQDSCFSSRGRVLSRCLSDGQMQLREASASPRAETQARAPPGLWDPPKVPPFQPCSYHAAGRDGVRTGEIQLACSPTHSWLGGGGRSSARAWPPSLQQQPAERAPSSPSSTCKLNLVQPEPGSLTWWMTVVDRRPPVPSPRAADSQVRPGHCLRADANVSDPGAQAHCLPTWRETLPPSGCSGLLAWQGGMVGPAGTSVCLAPRVR